jgi:hypothetical protein
VLLPFTPGVSSSSTSKTTVVPDADVVLDALDVSVVSSDQRLVRAS